MREILFRGKKIASDEWVEGSLLDYGDGDFDICVPCTEDGENGLYKYCVRPETVGQFTGMTDKNGKKIFEGDIIRYITPDDVSARGVICFGQYGCRGTIAVGFYVDWRDRDGAGWLRQDIGFWASLREIENVGNIHDNTDFMEVVT